MLPPDFWNMFDVIILTAGQATASLESSLIDCLYNDVMNFCHLVDVISQNQKLIYASSASVYGDTREREVSEEECSTALFNHYDLFKTTIDNVSLLEIRNKNKCIYGLRLGTVGGYSPCMRADLGINRMVNDALTLSEVHVSEHVIERAFLGMRDLCRVVERIIKYGTKETAGIYNVSSFNSTIQTAAHIVAQTYGVPLKSMQTKSSYAFRLSTRKFEHVFDFKFDDDIHSIIHELGRTACTRESKKRKYFDYYMSDKCRVCKTNTTLLLDLGHQPLANDYHQWNELLDVYPLQLHFCENCFHVQLNCTVSPEKLFKHYLYVSGTSSTGRHYFNTFARNTIERYKRLCLLNGGRTIRVLDIACNDGSQLDAFKNLANEFDINIVTVGVDPAENLCGLSRSKGHDIVCSFFDEAVVRQLQETYHTFDVVLAQNVFAHIDYPSKFLGLCKDLTDSHSLVYIQTSQANMIRNSEFDTAYHEHLSFFNTNSMKLLCDNNDLCLNRVDLVPIHGTSYVFEILHQKTADSNVVDFLYAELENGLYDTETYKGYNWKCLMYKNAFHNMILEYKTKGYNIIGYGSTAKSNTLLNFCKIDNSLIDCIVDENELKQGLLTPGSNIPIVDSSVLEQTTGNAVVVVFAWNFFDEINNKIKSIMKPSGNDVKILNINPLEAFDLN
jgi:nucleoside-diphosphate-sugar epimerase/SAM-dependent methyltransferase